MHPACPNKKQNYLQNSFRQRTQFWVRKTFSKPAPLKRASLVALPVAISHKASLKPKRCTSATLIQQTSKNLAVPFLGPHAPLSKRTKEKHFHGPIFGTVWRYQKWDRKIAKSTARRTRATNKKWQLRLVKQQAYRVGTEEARTCEAWFQLTFRPQKWNLKAHMWYQLSPFPSSNVAICDAATPRQHSPILRYSALLRYSVLCFNSITQCNWHGIETMAE